MNILFSNYIAKDIAKSLGRKALFSLHSSLLASLLIFSAVTTSCTEDSPKSSPSTVIPTDEAVIDRNAFPTGADVSWMTQMEAEGYSFYNQDGTEKELLTLLRDDCGVNSVRLRVWVNPQSGWCNEDDVLLKARRATLLGMRVMIDFHFSDTWADPGSQYIPLAWQGKSFSELKTLLSDHVTSMLTKLQHYGISPEWVQIGNETRSGMMYHIDNENGEKTQVTGGGHYSDSQNFSQLVTAGYDAVKAVFPEAKVVVHIDSGDNYSYYQRIFGNLKTNGAKYDLIGISLYPDAASWQTYIASAVSNITKAYQDYGKDVVVAEFGMEVSEADACHDALATLIADGRATGHLAGVFYWEPQAVSGYNDGYSKGCFNKTGDQSATPTRALDAYKEME